jgi:flagellar biogenesis protein FliO
MVLNRQQAPFSSAVAGDRQLNPRVIHLSLLLTLIFIIAFMLAFLFVSLKVGKKLDTRHSRSSQSTQMR